eukprot:8986439-Lingulodinium_polyedra.AAC.1
MPSSEPDVPMHAVVAACWGRLQEERAKVEEERNRLDAAWEQLAGFTAGLTRRALAAPAAAPCEVPPSHVLRPPQPQFAAPPNLRPVRRQLLLQQMP